MISMKEMALPLTKGLASAEEVPHTISYFIRKLRQIASFDELPKDKRPPEAIWDNSEELEEWFSNVFEHRKPGTSPNEVLVIVDDIEE